MVPCSITRIVGVRSPDCSPLFAPNTSALSVRAMIAGNCSVQAHTRNPVDGALRRLTGISTCAGLTGRCVVEINKRQWRHATQPTWDPGSPTLAFRPMCLCLQHLKIEFSPAGLRSTSRHGALYPSAWLRAGSGLGCELSPHSPTSPLSMVYRRPPPNTLTLLEPSH